MLRCCSPSRAVLSNGLFDRSYFSMRRSTSSIQRNGENIVVPCQSNGSITLQVYHPTINRPPEAGRPHVAIYLPRGSLLANAVDDESNVSILRSALSCPVIQLNYRSGKPHQYPVPIHDLAVGFDWVIDNLLPKSAITRQGRSEHVGKMVVCGELIGGQLATTLALTECRIGEPGIVAAAVNNPIANWVNLDEGIKKQSSSTSSTSLAMKDVLGCRDTMFRKSEHYFDPFASPTLFFRSAGTNVPVDEDIKHMDDLAELALLDREDFFRHQLLLSSIASESEHVTLPRDNETQGRKRKASRRFPSKELGLRLPAFNVTAGSASPLRKQAEELTHLLRQSLVRQEIRERFPFGQKASKKDSGKEVTKDMLSHFEHPGLGLWDTTNAGQLRMKKVASWMGHMLSR